MGELAFCAGVVALTGLLGFLISEVIDKRDQGSTTIPVIFSFPNNSLSRSDLAAFNHATVNVFDSEEGHYHGERGRYRALFHNEATNFTAEGLMTGIGEDGILRGDLYVPFGETVVEGKWFGVDSNKANESMMAAFSRLENALVDLEGKQDLVLEMLEMLSVEDAVAAV